MYVRLASWPRGDGRPRRSRVTLIENFASRKTVKEKLNDRRIAEPPMNENNKKIRELTEAMHAERDIRIHNRMMAVLGFPKGHSTKIASDFADGATVGCPIRRGRHRWPPGRPRSGQDFPRKVRANQETGRQACRQEHAHPEKAAKLDTLETGCQVQPVQRAQDPALPRVLVQEVCYHVCLGSRC